MKGKVLLFTVILSLFPVLVGAWELPGKDLLKKIDVPGAAKSTTGQADQSNPSGGTKGDTPAATTAPASSPIPNPVEKLTPQPSRISPDQADANACSAYVHEDYKKSKKALETTTLVRGSARYLPKNEWVDYLKGKYPNVKRDKNDFYIRFGKWFGKSCAYVNMKCVPKEPGCDLEMRCLDFYTRKGGQTCPSNICDSGDTKCIEPYKPPTK